MENGKWRIESLAAKITLPFVALFAVLLLALGWVLAREIFAEVESSVESEQRFVLEVAAFPGWPLSDESLRQIRDRSGSQKAGAQTEFIVLQNGQAPLTTFINQDPDASRLFEAFLNQLSSRAEIDPRDDTIRRHSITLDQRSYMLLATARAPRGATPATPVRRFFLLHPAAEIQDAQNRALARLAVLGLAGLGLAAALGLALAHWIARPVQTLAAAARRVTQGGLDQPLEFDAFAAEQNSVTSGGETGELSRAFRSMIDSLRQSQASLLRAERLAVTGKLAASVAHEIRNPLTSLRMTVQMLQARQKDPDAQTREAFRIVVSEIDRLALAVEELLTFARPRPAQKVPGDLNKLVTETLAFLEHQLAHAKITAKFEADANVPGDFAFDAHKLRQLLVNLILNAMQAMVRNGVVTVRTRWRENPAAVILEVEDSGPGIAPEVRERIFEIFVSTKPAGGGLGLVIAKQIAEEHGGTITFESAPGRTVFRVELPK